MPGLLSSLRSKGITPEVTETCVQPETAGEVGADRMSARVVYCNHKIGKKVIPAKIPPIITTFRFLGFSFCCPPERTLFQGTMVRAAADKTAAGGGPRRIQRHVGQKLTTFTRCCGARAVARVVFNPRTDSRPQQATTQSAGGTMCFRSGLSQHILSSALQKVFGASETEGDIGLSMPPEYT